ncbi:MAG: hypothetical protein AAGA62_08770 [Bacteroidota bacterium]
MSSSELLDDTAIPGNFAVFQRFNRREDMEYVIGILRNHHIAVRTSEDMKKEWRESVIIGNPIEPKFWIEIPASNFERANFFLQEAANEEISEEDVLAHPFAEYSVEELREVLLEETEWSPEAVVVARRLLLRSGEEVDLAALRQAHRDRLKAEYRPRTGNILSILLTTIIGTFAGFILWFVGIMFTIGILLYYRVGTRLDPKGVRHWAYVKNSRSWALVGLVLMGGSVTLGLLNYFVLHLVPIPDVDSWLWWWR